MSFKNFVKDKILDTTFITAAFLFILILVSKYLGGYFVNPDFLHLLSENIYLRNFMMIIFVFFSFNFVDSTDDEEESNIGEKFAYTFVLYIFFIAIMRTPPYFIVAILCLLSVIYFLDSNRKKHYYKIQVYVYFVTLCVIILGNYVHMKNYKKMLGNKFSYLKFYFDKHISQDEFNKSVDAHNEKIKNPKKKK